MAQDLRQVRRSDLAGSTSAVRELREPHPLLIFGVHGFCSVFAAASRASGKTRMSSIAGPHEGLNVPHYVWATSPLRRYSDLLNQRQLLALVSDDAAPYANGNAELLAAVADFDATYSGYGDFQQQREFYWCLRYIQQENISKLTAHVIRENLVRFDRLPMVQRINDMPSQPAGMESILVCGE